VFVVQQLKLATNDLACCIEKLARLDLLASLGRIKDLRSFTFLTRDTSR
jgi:hypothetical protein